MLSRRYTGFLIGLFVLVAPSVAFADVAYDNSAQPAGGSAPTVSTSYTVTGSNPALLVLVYNDANTTDNVTGVTYNGVAMTQQCSSAASGVTFVEAYTLLGPATGSNTLSVSLSSGQIGRIQIVSYTGVDQTNGIDVAACTGNGNTTDLTQNITTTVAGVWGVGLTVAAGTPSASTNINSTRINTPTNWIIGDSNGSLGNAGTYSVGFSQTPSTQWLGGTVIGVRPAAAAASVRRILAPLLAPFWIF